MNLERSHMTSSKHLPGPAQTGEGVVAVKPWGWDKHGKAKDPQACAQELWREIDTDKTSVLPKVLMDSL